MEILKNIKFSQKVQYTTVPLIIIFLVVSGLIIKSTYNRNILNLAQHQSEIYIDKIIQIFDLTEKQTGAGFTSSDYSAIKQYFQTPAFYETDFPFLVSSNGSYLVHILREGQMVQTEISTKLKDPQNKQGSFTYMDFDNNKTQERILTFKFYEPYRAYVAISTSPKEVLAHSSSYKSTLAIIIAIFIAITYIAIRLAIKPLANRLNGIRNNLNLLSKGIIPNKIKADSYDELGDITNYLNTYTDSIKNTTNFANNIGNNNLDTNYQLLSKDDSLGNALLNLRSSLISNHEEEEKRKKEDEIRAWTNLGLAKFADILRQNNNDLNVLGDDIIRNLVNYLDANQGGIFLTKESNNEKVLDLLSAFAYNRKKIIQKTIALGEGLIGTCALERQTIYLKEIPDDYITITSGLGEATPTSLLLIPLKLEEEVFGVIETASFHEFAPYEIEFIEKVGISIASTLSSAQNNIRTKFLLEQSQQQREEMSAQEEEMRQNMEEMQATQEEMSRKQVELEGITNAINQGLVFMVLNEDGLIMESNANTLNLFGLTKLEVEGNPLIDFIEKKQKNEYKQLWEGVLNGEQVESTLHIVAGNNNKDIYLQATISPEVDEMGSILKIILLGNDITSTKNLELKAQKQAEEIDNNLKKINAAHELEAEQKKEKLELLMALDQYCLITIIEPSGLITFINNKNVETLGDAKEKIEGKYLQDIDFSAKHQPEKFLEMWNNLLQGKIQQRDFSLNVNNKEVWIHENFTPIMGKNGKPTKFINIGFDITTAKELETKLLNLQEEFDKFKNKQ